MFIDIGNLSDYFYIVILNYDYITLHFGYTLWFVYIYIYIKCSKKVYEYFIRRRKNEIKKTTTISYVPLPIWRGRFDSRDRKYDTHRNCRRYKILYFFF